MLSATVDRHCIYIVVKAIVSLEFGAYRLLQFDNTGTRHGVLGKTTFYGANSRIFDILRRIEVWFTSGKSDNIDPFALE